MIIWFIEKNIIPDLSFDVTKYVAALFCFIQLISVLENESSCNDAWWARALQKFLMDKSKRHFDMDIDIDKLREEQEEEDKKKIWRKRRKMKITNEGINLIKKFEGLRLEAYLCPAGVWTIGYGHTKGVKKGDKITEETANMLLELDLNDFIVGVQKLLKKNINNNQFSALVSFAFNLGLANLKSSTLLKKSKF